MTRIFISYSRRDKSLADYIAAQLRNRGAEVFVDYQRLLGGENFIERLGVEIARCDYFVILLSPRSVESRWVRTELSWAFTSDKQIVPVLLETCSMVKVFVLTPLEQIDFTRWSLDGQVEAAVLKLAASLSLPAAAIHAEPVPTLVTGDMPSEVEEELPPSPVIFPRKDLSELFLTAAEVTENDPEQALFLYRQVVEIDPDFMLGQVQEFVARQEVRLNPARLGQMLNRAQDAMRAGRWQQGEQIGHDMLTLDEGNADARQIIQTCQANAPGEAQYQLIVSAVQHGRPKAAETLLRDFRQVYPSYGDPGKILSEVYPFELPLFAWCDILGPLPAFCISKYPITNAQYAVFVNHPLGYVRPDWWDYSDEAQAWRAENLIPTPGEFTGDKRPRENVAWYDAVAFCRWLSYLTGEQVTLPTEEQWQWAAQGNRGGEYPWGNEFDSKKCNTEESNIGQTTDVDRYPAGASPFGVMDMAGNVWEWCLNEFKNPANTDLTGDVQRVVRGGSWNYNRASARVVSRNVINPDLWNDYFGFRVVCASPFSINTDH